MRNSLRRLRKEKRLSLRQVGDKLGIPFQTLANYEKTEGELPVEVIEKAAKFFDVSKTEVTKEWTDLREEPLPYRVQSLAIDLLPDETLRLVRKIFSDQLPTSHEPDTTRIMHSLFALNEELKRRPELVIHSNKKSAPANSGEVSQLAASSAEALAKVLPGDDASSERPHGAGAPPAHKEARPVPSAPASKPPHSAHGGKGQK